VIDGSYSQNKIEAWKADLTKVYNRGFSSGYYLGKKQGWSDKPGSKATHRKDFVGTISNYFSKQGVIQVDSAAVELGVGDEYVIVGHTTGAVKGVVAEIRVDQNGVMVPVEIAPKGMQFSMVHDGEARRRDQIYRLTPLEPAEV
jgi:putative protease